MERKRCPWVNLNNPRYVAYHDEEWGRPCHDEHQLYALLILECFQAGLSWECVLNKREAFFRAYDGFDAAKVAAYSAEKQAALLQNPGIIRNRGKIQASVKNTRVFLQIQEHFGSFDRYIWGFTEGRTICENDPAVTKSPLSDRIAGDLRQRGMAFVGSTTVYAYLQAIGVIDAHAADCFLCRKRRGEAQGQGQTDGA